jgi:hypothetical protein
MGNDERLLWYGMPRQGIVVRSADVRLIPFTLLWSAFALFAAGSTLTENGPLFPKLFVLPFIFIAIYITIGRFLVDAFQRSRTYYGLTTSRIIIISSLFRRTVHYIVLRNLDEVFVDEDSSGCGTITFGPPRYWWEATGLGSRHKAVPSFDLISDVKSVYQKILVALRNAQ